MIGAVRLDGSTACMTVGGATDTEVFRTYAEWVLCPTLRPGDIVVMDYLGAHKSPATLQLIGDAGAEARFLPAYSPDDNPIETMWSKTANLPRGAEERTPEQLATAIAAALEKVTTKDARGLFVSFGYSFI